MQILKSIINWVAPTSVIYLKHFVENRGKTPKCTKNDPFRQIYFLNTACFHSNYTPFDAELHAKFFEIVCKFLTRSVLELLTKIRSKNRRRNFGDPKAPEIRNLAK